jgi:hypothetical protein
MPQIAAITSSMKAMIAMVTCSLYVDEELVQVQSEVLYLM